MSEPMLIDFKDETKWMAARKGGIGASEVAILFGVAPGKWGSPLKMWLEKTGKIGRDGAIEEWQKWGHRLEPAIADGYVEETGNKLWSGGGKYQMAQHPSIPFFRCTPDRWVVEADGRATPGLLQIKNTASFMAHNWDLGIPDHIQIQEQAEMAVTGADWADVAVLIGGNQFKHFTVKRDPEFIAEIEEQVRHFWRLVETDVAPPADATEATTEVLKRLHPLDDGSTVELPEEAIELWARLEAFRADETEAKKAKAGPQNALAMMLGSATFGKLPDGRQISYRHQHREGYTVDPTDFRVMRLDGGKRGRK